MKSLNHFTDTEVSYNKVSGTYMEEMSTRCSILQNIPDYQTYQITKHTILPDSFELSDIPDYKTCKGRGCG
jgi:hypothetical protein